jgi:hypothetical protein
MFTINLEYDVTSNPRYGHGRRRHERLVRILEQGRDNYSETIEDLKRHVNVFQTFSVEQDPANPTAPYWNNGFLPGLDIASLYHFVTKYKPATYLEVGSGNSTMVVRRAIQDHGLSTKIVSIDPYPRAQIDGLCDTVIRQPLENVNDLGMFEMLEPGDIVYLDSSHRVFMNSDVTAFFLDILPNLAAGVIVHIHDIFLPDDYPSEWIDRYYSEQYLLACYLLAESPRLKVLLPNHFVFTDAGLHLSVVDLWKRVGTKGLEMHGGSFWLQIQ